MKAVGYNEPGPLDRDDALIDFEADRPTPQGHDLLVEVSAISVNPVDYKIRSGRPPLGDGPAISGWDAVGTVAEAGSEASRFQPGDKVWYAGAINRPGTNAEFHLVDERIVGTAPTSIGNAEAAALPLTAITAWEMLFDRLRIKDPVPGATPAILIIGGAGGVGSIATQLARQLTDLTVISTASRPETTAWATDMGAHHVINHHESLADQVEALGVGAPGYVFSTTHTQDHFAQIVELIAPQGRFGLIDDPPQLDVMPFKQKSVSTHWELMFTRPLFATADMAEQGALLDEVAKLVDAGTIRSTMTDNLGTINAANVRVAHAQLESAGVRGKLVLEGF